MVGAKSWSGPSHLLFPAAACSCLLPAANCVPLCCRCCALQVPNVDGLKREEDKRAKKNWDIALHSVWGPGQKTPLVPEVFTPAGVPACSTPVLKSLAGKAGKARKKLAELGLEQEAEGERWELGYKRPWSSLSLGSGAPDRQCSCQWLAYSSLCACG